MIGFVNTEFMEFRVSGVPGGISPLQCGVVLF